MKDVHPREIRVRRRVEGILQTLFGSWGYTEVEPPTFEYYSTLEKVIGKELKERIFRFVNREGRLVCLRPDFTTSIVRMYSSKLTPGEQNCRVFYDGKIFRYPASPFRTESELTQVGLENIGVNNPSVDAEVIALAISALRKVGIEDFSCDIGHVGIFQGMMDSMGYPDPLQEQLKTIVKRKDFIDLDYFLTLHPPEELPMHSLLEEFPYLRGKKELLGEFQKKISPNRRFQEAFERLSRIWDILADFGLEKYLFINLGLIRDFDYYSGVIFEGFSPFSGSPLLTGGRYDELFGVFGKDHPACGFALFAERLIEVLQQSGPVKDDREKTIILSYHPSLRGEVFSLSQDLRSMGMMVLISEDSGGEELLRVTLNGRLIFTGIPEWIALRETIKKEITNG